MTMFATVLPFCVAAAVGLALGSYLKGAALTAVSVLALSAIMASGVLGSWSMTGTLFASIGLLGALQFGYLAGLWLFGGRRGQDAKPRQD